MDRLAQLDAPPATLATLVRELNLPKSSVHNLLNTLQSVELIQKGNNGSYTLASRVIHWAEAYSRQNDLVSLFNARAGQIAELQAETLMLSVLDGHDVLYLGCRPGTRSLAVNFRVGGRIMAHCTATGKTIFASMAPDLVTERLLQAHGKKLPGLTPRSITSLTKLKAELKQIHEQGYAIDDEEAALGMHCFGAPIYGAATNGSDPAVAKAAVAVCLIKASTTTKQRQQMIQAIKRLANDISQALGARS